MAFTLYRANERLSFVLIAHGEPAGSRSTGVAAWHGDLHVGVPVYTFGDELPPAIRVSGRDLTIIDCRSSQPGVKR